MKNVIELSGAVLERFNVNIERTLYTFFIQYNARYSFWTLSLYINDVPLFEGFKIVQGVNIGDIFHLPFSGKLYIESITNKKTDPTRDDLGVDQQLIYDDLIP
jgi:hypothetical protein